eukprot:g10786.t1
MCAGAVTEALRLGMDVVFQRDSASNLFLVEQLRSMAGVSPDVLVVCADYQVNVELMMGLDFIHFNPKAIIMWDSSNSNFYETLLVSSAVHILDANAWSDRFEPCSGGSCQTISRRDFFTSYQGRYGTAPSLVAAQAAAAGTEGNSAILSTLSRDLTREGNKDSFYHPLSFNNKGFLRAVNIEVTQLAAQNLTTARRLQGPPPGQGAGPQQAGPQQPGAAPQSTVPIYVEAITTEELLAYTRVQPILKGIYFSEGSEENVVLESDYQSLEAMVTERPPEEERKVIRYPCDLGFEVRTAELWTMMNFVELNMSGGPTSPCAPCYRGNFRSLRSSSCSKCAPGTQATNSGQSECTETWQHLLNMFSLKWEKMLSFHWQRCESVGH